MFRDPQQPVVCIDDMFSERDFTAVTVGAWLLPSSVVTHYTCEGLHTFGTPATKLKGTISNRSHYTHALTHSENGEVYAQHCNVKKFFIEDVMHRIS